MTKLKKLVLVLLMGVISRVEMSQEVMKNMAINFAKPLEICRKELDLSDAVTKEFSDFWREGHVLANRQTGCAIMCIASKLDLLDPEYNLHHKNAHEFALKHGADDAMAKQLVDIIHKCSETVSNPDPCINALAVAQCFKDKIHELNWAPNVDLIMGEVLAEI